MSVKCSDRCRRFAKTVLAGLTVVFPIAFRCGRVAMVDGEVDRFRNELDFFLGGHCNRSKSRRETSSAKNP
jgi:hypothetical protein